MNDPAQHTENYVALSIGEINQKLIGLSRKIQRRGRGAKATEEEQEEIVRLREQRAELRRREREGTL